MKKSLSAIVAIVAVAALFALGGCSSVPANKTLSIMWKTKETAVYSATYKKSETETIKGTLTTEAEKIDGGQVTMTNGETVDTGANPVSRITNTLVMENGDTVFSEALLRNSFLSIASYRKSVIDGKEVSVYSTYDEKKYNYKANDGEEKTGQIKLGKFDTKPYYDDAVFYYVLRAPIIKKDALSFSFAIPQWNENSLTSLTASVSKVVSVKAPFAESPIECYETVVRLNQKTPPPGLPIYCYMSKSALDAAGGSVNRAIVKIIEGDTTFELVSLTTSAE